jgi:hypothetical protein
MISIKKVLILILFVSFSWLIPNVAKAQVNQGQQLRTSQQFRLGERIIRVAEPGQLADTLNVWGDVNSAGRYLIPRQTTLPELISYTFGPSTIRDGQTDLDWSKVRVEINISGYNGISNQEEIANFKYRFNEPLPDGMRTFDLKNNQVVSVQVKRRPSFVDYVRVIAPVLSSIATGFLIIDRL